ncbi:DUF4157 domain-containing protein [Cellulomonas sp. Leaf334]|uniref:eCIS core domain-containing protein n=1 Tax=Cellulomonas sp. Leaf334 TaxID=1736339 RepID=UPI0006F5E20C|nr:DUF4157 domain-containing protein [Cellulomonas sp. Leaf334]KQR16432.1 hypothetical protein ASF78_03335 [Cellulomonas sp. Leaf334]
MPTPLAREVVQEPERRHRTTSAGSPAARQPVGALHSNGELARLARAGGSPPTAALTASSNRVARASLAVTHPDDPVEREAERVASDVVHRRTAPAAVAAPSAPTVPPAGRSGGARDSDTGPAPAVELGSVAEHAEEIAEGGQVEVPQAVASLIASPGTGVPLEPGVQARVAPVLGADLSAVRVHQGPDASAAAAALQARAFTVGADIFLGEGESATDLELMAHESTHVVQQQAVGVYRAEVARLALGTVMPDWLIADIQSIPGYSVVSTVVGSDPITGESATESRQGFVEKLLTFGPFGAASGPVLQAAKVLDDVFTMLDEGLKRHNLTFDRVLADLDSAWDEMSITEGVEFNLAIARRYLSAIVNDVKAFLSEIADAVIAKVRSVLAAVAEPLLEKDSIAPYWNLAKKVLHTNPLTGEDVPATTVEILTEFLKVIGQQKVLDQMIERGTLQKTADWVDSKIDQFKSIVGQVAALLEQAGAALSPANLPNLLDTLPALADQAFSIIKQIGDFAQDVIAQVLVLVKDSLLAWLSSYAKKIPGYELLTVILEKDPFTGDAVPRTAENLIKGFILLLPGGEDMYAKLAESGVIANAAGRITSAMTELNISWALITDTFLGLWNLVTLESLLSPIETFDKILDQFGDPLSRIIRFAAVVVQVVVELILRLMNFPPEIFGHILSQVESAIEDIKRDPVEFLLNVVEAMKQGFSRFFDNILEHLLKGLAAWMFRGLKSLGIETPTELTLEAAITLVIQVSGVTVELLWQRLAAKIGQEKVDKIRQALELAGQAFDFIKDVQERGIEAIWDKISEQLTNLWDLIFDAAKSWIMKEIVNKAIAKVLSMLDPTGIMAVVNSCIAFFKAVQSVLDYMRELLELIDSYVSTVAQIAKGNVGPGAAMLETGLANAVPVAIGFLANQAGLGDVPEQVKQIIIDLRAKIIEAIDWLIDKAVALAQSALSALGLGGEETPADDKLEAEVGVQYEGAGHEIFAVVKDGHVLLEMASANRREFFAQIDELLTLTESNKDPGIPAKRKKLLGMRDRIAALDNLWTTDVQWKVKEERQRFTVQLGNLAADAKTALEELAAAAGVALGDLNIVDGRVVAGVSIRETYYPKKFDSDVPAKFAPKISAAMADARTRFAADIARRTAGGEIGDWYTCPGPDYASHHLANRNYEPIEKDHRMSVSAHWNSSGRSTGPSDRKDWYSDIANLEVMCEKHNRSKGGASVGDEAASEDPKCNREVGPGFVGT